MTVHVVARLTARPETGAELQTLLLSMIEPTRQEVGCLRYELLQNAADPTDFTFVEEWADTAALDAHSATPHLQAVLAQAPALLAVAPDIRRYTALQ
ncbi:MAG: antibiotic biosynthesis monooxygenase [Candidatus Competibacteraceae bacterium]|nr:antibiotic biosynthesis monooxygenase [Candidatus Competibacteraceae bacterium]MCP5124891.1 antibiotic biosynthesis monooxygenase [Gammaproteobacteria bacterium]HRX71001.1 putative quinol monooxygenase [Candidatus Competibacteraceae bacterium]